MRIRADLLCLSFTLILTLTLSNIGTVNGVTEPTIYIDPHTSYKLQNERFNITVRIKNAEDVFSWQVQINFDPNILEAINATEGDFLKDQPQGTFFAVNVRSDYILFGASSYGEVPGAGGSGTLATVEFLVNGIGSCILNITDPTRTYLLNRNLNKIPYIAENGYFTNIEIPPIADFTYSPTRPQIGETITFNASASYDPDGNIVLYKWDFGDGTNATGEVVTHAYTVPGTVTVTLTIWDEGGLDNTISKDVGIRFMHNIAVSDIAASPTTVKVSESVSVTVTVLNKGTETETFDVTVYYDSTSIGTKTVTDLAPDDTETLTFPWDTSDVAEGTYMIKAVAGPLSGEMDTSDNTRLAGTVTVSASASTFPIQYVAVAVAVIVVLIGGLFFYIRRKPA